MSDPIATTRSTIFGIKNCDTMKKAFAWCSDHDVNYEFHDYKKQGVTREKLVAWCKVVGWKSLLNTKGTTWQRLDPKPVITAQGQAVTLMLEHNSLIRRPVVETADGRVLVGFDPTLFDSFVR
jgi:arsenate reductase (glutaredoxin)